MKISLYLQKILTFSKMEEGPEKLYVWSSPFHVLYLHCSKIVTDYYSVFLFLKPIATMLIFVSIVALIKFSGNTFHFRIYWLFGEVVWIIVGNRRKEEG